MTIVRYRFWLVIPVLTPTGVKNRSESCSNRFVPTLNIEYASRVATIIRLVESFERAFAATLTASRRSLRR